MVDKQKIKQFWNNQAIEYGNSFLATVPDAFAKELEIENISKFLKPGMYVADIGCGNGYSSFKYAEISDIKVLGIDYSQEMIANADNTLKESSSEIKNRLSFIVGDVTSINLQDNLFDSVITDRCLINLISREEQIKAVTEIHRLLKPLGIYLMCEDTEQGLRNLNRIRKQVGLDEINVRWHNLYLDEEFILKSIDNLFELVDTIKFSSFYYLASRIINGKLAQEKGEEPKYDSDINKIARMCSSLGDFGDFGPLKLFVFSKKS